MEITREEAIARLVALGQIPYPKPSARALRPQIRQMLHRVERMEQRSYQEKIAAQKKELTADIKKIDVYLQSVKDYEGYLAREAENGFEIAPTIAPTILEKPTIFFKPVPILRTTKIKRYKQRRKHR